MICIILNFISLCSTKTKLYRPVFVFVRAPPAVFAVVIVGTCIALTAQPGRFFAKLGLIVGEHKTGVCMRRNEHRTAWRMTYQFSVGWFLCHVERLLSPCQRGSSLRIFSMSALLATTPDCPSPDVPSTNPVADWVSNTWTSLNKTLKTHVNPKEKYPQCAPLFKRYDCFLNEYVYSAKMH